jgi:hypothetical protein
MKISMKPRFLVLKAFFDRRGMVGKTGIQTDGQMDRWTDRRTDGWTGRQTGGERDQQTDG